jgi:hypothetical protein
VLLYILVSQANISDVDTGITPKEVELSRSRIAKVLTEDLDLSTKDFLESILKFYDKKNILTNRQYQAFEKIESRFSPQEKLKWESWKKEYKEFYYPDSKIIASYYLKAGYYSTLANKITYDESFVPNRKDFLKMYKNSYAQKVVKATRSEPKFEVGAQVQIRKTAGKTYETKYLKSLRLRRCFVLQNDLPVVNAVNGAKRYRILPMGYPNPVDIDERFLMKLDKRGKNS